MTNLFSVFTSKLFLGLSGLLLVLLSIQTIRIEGAFCRTVRAGEKPSCIYKGFKQQLAVIRIDLDQVRAERNAEIAKHEATKKAYRDAQLEAEMLEKERLTRVLAQQKEITNERSQSFDRSIAAARADADRLRRELAQTRSSSARPGQGLSVPGVPNAAGQADGEASGDGFSIGQRLEATKNSIQLDELILWIRGQIGVPVNGN